MKKIALDYRDDSPAVLIAKEIVKINKATQLTGQQQALLDYYLEDNSHSEGGLVRAASSAGYQGSSASLEALSRAVILWFERNTASSDIFRIMDLGETKVVKKLKAIIEGSSNQSQVLKAIQIVAGILKAEEENFQGANIAISVNQGDTECFKLKHDEHMLNTQKKHTITIVR